MKLIFKYLDFLMNNGFLKQGYSYKVTTRLLTLQCNIGIVYHEKLPCHVKGDELYPTMSSLSK